VSNKWAGSGFGGDGDIVDKNDCCCRNKESLLNEGVVALNIFKLRMYYIFDYFS